MYISAFRPRLENETTRSVCYECKKIYQKKLIGFSAFLCSFPCHASNGIRRQSSGRGKRLKMRFNDRQQYQYFLDAAERRIRLSCVPRCILRRPLCKNQDYRPRKPCFLQPETAERSVILLQGSFLCCPQWQHVER